MKKHLIYLVDGTWMFSGKIKANEGFTNIHKINSLLDYEDRTEDKSTQIVFYSRGLGSGKKILSYSAGVLGWGIWDDIEEIYLNICSNYRRGDKIYLIGFSRGGIVARVVAGLLNIGLLKLESTDHLNQIKTVYLNIADKIRRHGVQSPADEGADLKSIREFCQPEAIKVQFLGIFDSVIGGYNSSRIFQELNAVESMPASNVKHAMQILAIDETRHLFRPNPFKGNAEKNSVDIEQIWFPGVHSDIGGGYENSLLSDISLLTMLDRILKHTDLAVKYSGLASQYCKKQSNPINIHNDFAQMKFKIISFLAKKRSLVGANRSIHPIVDILNGDEITNKGVRVRYSASEFSEIPRSPLFISSELGSAHLLL